MTIVDLEYRAQIEDLINVVGYEQIFMNSEMLKTRTKKFAVEIAKLCEDLPPRLSMLTYSKQLIRCSSSVGANYRAACRAKSLPDFINKLKIVEEEADESIYFMELIEELDPSRKASLNPLKIEGNELLSIVVASINTAKNKRQTNRQSSI